MPRKRMLYPAFFSSEQIAALSLHAAYTYEGFWCFADDRGRMLDDPEELWALVWFKRRREVPMDEAPSLVQELVTGGQLCRYSVGGSDFLHTVAWDEHQKVSHPTPSKLPPCPDHQPGEWAMWWKDKDTATDRWRQAEKGLRAAELASRNTPESFVSSSGSTPPQFSSVQVSSGEASSGGAAAAHRNPPPPGNLDPKNPRCLRHLEVPASDPGPNCLGCKRVREWCESAPDRAAADDLSARRSRREAIDACGLCDDTGYVLSVEPVRRCEHLRPARES